MIPHLHCRIYTTSPANKSISTNKIDFKLYIYTYPLYTHHSSTMKFSTFLILPLAAAASAQVSPCSLFYSLITFPMYTQSEQKRLTISSPNSHRALHQNKVRDHQTAFRQRHRQRGQGVPRPSRRAASSQEAKGRARARARGQARGAAARGRRGQGEQRAGVVALDRRAVSRRARAVGRFRMGVTAATAARPGRRAAARRLQPPAPPGRRGRDRPLAGRAACRRLRRRRRRWCLTAGLL